MIALDAVTPLSQIPEKPRKVIRMQTGGDPEKKLAEGPPENIDMLPRFEGFEPGPNQFMLQEEETVIPSEPNVISEPTPNTFPIPIPDNMPIPSEPSFDTGKQEFPGPGMKMQDFIFNTPSIRPQEVYPRDPDPGIMGIQPNRLPNNGVPNLLQAKDLKPAGILSINKVYDI